MREIYELRVFGRYLTLTLTTVTEKRKKDKLVENEGKNCTFFFSQKGSEQVLGGSETLAVF